MLKPTRDVARTHIRTHTNLHIHITRHSWTIEYWVRRVCRGSLLKEMYKKKKKNHFYIRDVDVSFVSFKKIIVNTLFYINFRHIINHFLITPFSLPVLSLILWILTIRFSLFLSLLCFLFHLLLIDAIQNRNCWVSQLQALSFKEENLENLY